MNKQKPKQVYSVRLDELLNDSLDEYALNSHTRKSTVIRHAIYAYLRQVHVLQIKHV